MTISDDIQSLPSYQEIHDAVCSRILAQQHMILHLTNWNFGVGTVHVGSGLESAFRMVQERSGIQLDILDLYMLTEMAPRIIRKPEKKEFDAKVLMENNNYIYYVSE